MSTKGLRKRKYTTMVNVVQDRVDATFKELHNRNLKATPTWLYYIYNDFTRVQENYQMSVKEKLQKLLAIIKALFCGTIININHEAALAVNKRVPVTPY